MAIRPSASVRRTSRPRCLRSAHAVRGAPGVVARRGAARAGSASASPRPSDALVVGVLDAERPDRRPPQLLAVGVAEVGDQRAHVGARWSSRSRGARGRRRATAPRSACTSTSRSGSSTASPARASCVGAPAADLDRRVRRRALAQDAGRQAQRLGRHAPRARARRRGRRSSTSTPAARPSRRTSGSAIRKRWMRVAAPDAARAAARSRTGPACPAWPTFTPLPSAPPLPVRRRRAR